ncbi:EscU/YscU/HrcU family type III secretion system export apparatus switch protein [Falsiroseomonas stagni]|uniref:Flagellar biosynthetic protein FlhB n=1 Tax=Falsiroseomonas stagni DSM 19981 TaxID=1123062 RepID=A0A1I4CFZ6_9PROT|nr:EscU/YscU/HrcU family type III secretion system export apparatus switch protein [Falsiroseomonas stagni]SFK79693.1 flagellar biosynthetic protein FlhB [Falsiroseomonas stagni DSM 19981]
MAEEGDGPEAGDKTEAATPKRLEKAREEGQVALSREVVGWTGLAAGTLATMLVLPTIGFDLMRAMRGALESAHTLGIANAAMTLFWWGALVVIPVAAAVSLGAVAGTLAQTRGLVSAKPMVPRLSKISPWAGLKRLVGPEALMEFLRTLLKLLIVGAALWHVGSDLAALQAALHQPAAALPQAAGAVAMRLMMAALVAFAGVALLDLLWVRFRFARQMRMSRQDLRDEAKESDGDPMLKARRRQMRQVQGRRRMMAAVPNAAVVITNPTHYAVALAYGGGEAAPRIVAKGVDAMAARIREAATSAGVPLVANPPLARALWRLDIDAEIPAEHYQAMAEIIAYVWRQNGAAARHA